MVHELGETDVATGGLNPRPDIGGDGLAVRGTFGIGFR